MTSKPFTTATGQTGKDAYTYELAQIRNLQRDLDERLQALAAAMEAELPADASYTAYYVSADYPVHCDRGTITRQLALTASSGQFSHETIAGILETLEMRSPEREERDMDMLRQVRAILDDAPGTTVSSLQVDEFGTTHVRITCGSESVFSWATNALNGADLNDHPTRPRTLQVFGMPKQLEISDLLLQGTQDPFYLQEGETVLWVKDNGDGTAVVRTRDARGTEGVIDADIR